MATPSAAPRLMPVRRAVKRALFASGYYGRRLSHLTFPGVAVLCYHSVRADGDAPVPFNRLHVRESTFERHCEVIAAHCDPISLADLSDARRGVRVLPPRAVLVTFDDGYRAVLDRALPILERHRIPAIVFACLGPITRGTHFWFDSVCRTAGESAVLEARGAPIHTWTSVIRSSDTPAPVSDSHRPLTVGELRRLAASPLVDIGGHTVSHPTLALMSKDEQEREVDGCRGGLQDIVGTPMDAFAYPYGCPTHDYSQATIDVVKHAGFSMAFTTSQSFARVDCDAYQIPRFVMLDSIDEVELAHRLSFSWHV